MSEILLVVVLVLDIAAVVDVLGSGLGAGAKVLWVLVVLALPILGMVAYFALGRRQAKPEYPPERSQP